MIIGILIKALRRVKTYRREGKQVAGYTQRGPTAKQRAQVMAQVRARDMSDLARRNQLARRKADKPSPFRSAGGPPRGFLAQQKKPYPTKVKERYERNYQQITRWANSSVGHAKAKGTHIASWDDAVAWGVEAALEGLRRYDPKKGNLGQHLRPLIKYAVLDYVIWSRSKGMTGHRSLYDLVYAAATDEDREKILEKFPELTIMPEIPSQSIEDQLEAAAATLKRDEMLDQIEKEFGANLKPARAALKKQQAKRGQQTATATRKLKVYKMQAYDGLSFREIAQKLGIDVARVYSDFKAASEVVAKIRGGMEKQIIEKMKAEVATKKALPRDDHMTRLRFLNHLERLERAVKNEWPDEFQDFILDILANLFVELEGST